jgi:small subunit ribosomal protein S10
MMSKARITLSGENSADLDGVITQIRELASALGMTFKGPVRLPRRTLLIATRRTPCGDGSDTYERWEKRIHKRLVDIDGNEKLIRQMLRIKVPSTVYVKISLS